jgi:hypothetical protein
MLRLAGWLATIAAVTLLVWHTAVEESAWPRPLCAFLLLLVSILAGIRIGADAAAGYIKDLQRVNKALDDQNRELQEVNTILLKNVAAESQPTSERT